VDAVGDFADINVDCRPDAGPYCWVTLILLLKPLHGS
jgi:hypothetical protein